MAFTRKRRFRRRSKFGKSKTDRRQNKAIAKLQKWVGAPEAKQFNAAITTTALSAGTVVLVNLFPIAQGLTISDRIGNNINAIRMEVSVQMFADESASTTQTLQPIRAGLFKQKDINGTIATVDQILVGTTVNGHLSPPNYNFTSGLVNKYKGFNARNGGSVTIIKDRVDYLGYLNETDIAVADTFANNSSTLFPAAIRYKWVLNFPKGCKMSFLTSAGATTDWKDNFFGVYLLAVTASVSYIAKATLLYTDC